MCKNQKHIGMLEQFYTDIVVALRKTLTNSPQKKLMSLGRTRM